MFAVDMSLSTFLLSCFPLSRFQRVHSHRARSQSSLTMMSENAPMALDSIPARPATASGGRRPELPEEHRHHHSTHDHVEQLKLRPRSPTVAPNRVFVPHALEPVPSQPPSEASAEQQQSAPAAQEPTNVIVGTSRRSRRRQRRLQHGAALLDPQVPRGHISGTSSTSSVAIDMDTANIMELITTDSPTVLSANDVWHPRARHESPDLERKSVGHPMSPTSAHSSSPAGSPGATLPSSPHMHLYRSSLM